MNREVHVRIWENVGGGSLAPLDSSRRKKRMKNFLTGRCIIKFQMAFYYEEVETYTITC
jgi:hypothetical protein